MVYVFEKARCVAFDINGTLIDGKYKHWGDVMEKGLRFRRRENANLAQAWAKALSGRITFEEMAAEAYLVDYPEDIRRRAFDVYMADLRLRDGCIELLETLRKRYNLVTCSDTSGVTKVIAKKFGLEGFFFKHFYSCDIGYVKSDQQFWIKFLSDFQGWKAEEFVVVGDNPRADVFWPKHLGMGSIQIKTTELPASDLVITSEQEKPHVFVQTLDDIREVLVV